MMKFYLSYQLMCLFLASLVIGFIYPVDANAADKQDKSSRRAALMLQKIKQDAEQEKSAMQAQFNLQKKELEDKIAASDDALQKSNKSLLISQHSEAKLEGELSRVNAEKSALETKQQQTQLALDATEKNLEELKSLHAQAQADLKFNDGQRKILTANLGQTNKSLSICEEKNAKLHQYGTELIQIYEKPSVYEAAMRKESFFQLKRVELENILQNYQDNLNLEHIVQNKIQN